MRHEELPGRWADSIGLALSPLFAADDSRVPGQHSVMLDGGFGSFALSVSSEDIWRDQSVPNWAWSSDLPHHVTVTGNVVAVRRWDAAQPELLSLSSVESHVDAFYSYLVADKVRSSYRVVDHSLNLFRRARSLVSQAGVSDELSVEVFLGILSRLVDREGGSNQTAFASEDYSPLLKKLPEHGLESLLDDSTEGWGPGGLRLLPSLAIRHAGSSIFQEAHFELLRAPSMDLFGYSGPAVAKAVTRGGTHFTPPALARSVTEQALAHVTRWAERDELTILDPACGSGAFLHEALRTLRRLKYSGRVRILGRDTSSAAVSMARFVVASAVHDYEADGQTYTDIQVADSLAAPLPHADLVLMNPPFVSWAALDDAQRDSMKQVLGDQLQGRADLSMAFVVRALEALKPGGAVGALLPASLLNLKAADSWRERVAAAADIRVLASLGDFGLFTHAMVQVAATVLAKPEEGGERSGTTTALITTNSAEATGDALRALRRTNGVVLGEYGDDAWQLFSVPAVSVRARSTWRLVPPRTERFLQGLRAAGMPTVSDIFEVRQGVRTGDNAAFILDKQEFAALPQKEKGYFRPAVLNESIRSGVLQQMYWVFYPYKGQEVRIASEAELLRAVPDYAKKYLLPRKSSLARRSSRPDGAQWWLLSRERSSWVSNEQPHVVSKYFGAQGGFAVNATADFVTVQGFAWFLKTQDQALEDGSSISRLDLLRAYAALMNSEVFSRLIRMYSPHVAGGQYDLSPRYVDLIPVWSGPRFTGQPAVGLGTEAQELAW